MKVVAPKIGFDRFVKGEWATKAVMVRAGQADPEDVMALLESDGLSVAARKKTRTVLNRLWLEPRDELADFVDRGVALYRAGAPMSALHWGVSIATYPFFAHVAEMVGRLTAIQGDCATTEVHRRMSERYGEREGTYRMTNMVLQSQGDWGAIRRVEGGRRIVRESSIAIAGTTLTGWLIEAAIRSVGKPLPMAAVGSLPVLYPFLMETSLAYAAAENKLLEIRSVGAGREVIAMS
jgi:hypothetical protein